VPTTDPQLPDCFAGTQTDPLPDGGILLIKFHDPQRAGRAVEVTATNADDPSETRTVAIQLRGNGRGTAHFISPVGWGGIVLSAAGSRPHRVDVAVPP
jgi:hypothetical protein